MKLAACTIVSPNYLAFARTLAASFTEQHPGQRFYVLIVADLDEAAPFELDPTYTPVMLGEIGVPALRTQAMQYDILELNTNVKPTFLKYLLRNEGLDGVVYLDPDIYVYAPLEPVFQALEAGASAVLTPHMLAPVWDGRSPAEQDLLFNGTFNLGFLAVGNTEEGRRLLDWWEARCLGLGFSEGRTGLFVDQKWANLMPAFFAGVQSSRDPGLNMAYWNLHERRLVRDGGSYAVEGSGPGRVPLRFFHFSGVDFENEAVLSRNTDRFTLQDRPDLEGIFAAYRVSVRANRGTTAEALPYGFDRFSDGTAVNRLCRRVFAAHVGRFGEDTGAGKGAEMDPFAAAGAFARFARKQGLVKGKAAPGKATWREFNPADRRVEAVHRLLRLALRVLGPGRYELLMRYLGHISVLRNQGVFLRDPRWAREADGADPTHAGNRGR